MRYDSVLELIGRTPLVRLGRLGKGLKPEVYAKLDYMNPGGSVKDRIAIRMVDAAERDGQLRPGGTIIEGTSGNTGMGLALVAAVRGYKLIFTITDKQSREKIDLLKGLGAEVIVCPTAVTPDDPRSYYSVAKKLAQEIPNSFYPNQYDNPNNPQAHVDTTGPEIWDSSDGLVTHFVVGLGTGGTATGVGRYLKSQNPNIKIIGVDPVGSLFHEFFHTKRVGDAHPYVVEGIGEDIFPKNVDFSLLDDVIQVTDRDCFVTARHLARQEGIFAGGSAGGAVWAALRVAQSLPADGFVVVFIPDTGRQYVSKIYNDEWMRENRYLEPAVRLTAGECLRHKTGDLSLQSVAPADDAQSALQKMDELDVSQLPVHDGQQFVGAVTEDQLVALVLQGQDLGTRVVREVMESPFPTVDTNATIEQVTDLLQSETAILVGTSESTWDILTKADVVHAIAALAKGE